nr:MAG TPA: hypothetical protein [Caudoviricetes sp.]
METTNGKAGVSAGVGRCEMPEYIPKGGLCMNCAKFSRDCSRLDFTKMHVIKIYSDGVKAVKCTEYRKEARLCCEVGNG